VVVALLIPFGLHRLHLTWTFVRWRSRARPHAPASVDRDLPRITVQLPIYNERYVADRLIRTACALEYPDDRLEIQVLDDSTDDTSAIAARVVAELSAAGRPVKHVRRANRDGFKAGALAHGLARSRGELIAILDADFVPPPRLLHELLRPFGDPRVGMVQARWGHSNRDQSLLTRMQAVLLDGHFVIEHTARHASGRFFNFNGTAGMWRRTAIDDAGGWQHDTLTEDLDLSYRAQLAGWRFVYLPEVVVPGEVPVDMAGFRAQQRRWSMGSAQTARKLARPLWRARLPARVKLEAFAHLGGNLAYVLTALLSALLAPALACRSTISPPARWLLDLPLLAFGTGSVLVFYAVAQVAYDTRGFLRWPHIPLAIGLAASLSLTNATAVLHGIRGRQAAFDRTPKYGASAGRWRETSYRVGEDLPWAEGLLAASCLIALGLAVRSRDWLAVPFVSMLSFGYGYAAWRLVWDTRGARDRDASAMVRFGTRRARSASGLRHCGSGRAAARDQLSDHGANVAPPILDPAQCAERPLSDGLPGE
jgi:cellulose synthase/poly-beta-1,6-N-acetylglucosamine synthase-like glycosyltransferase